VAKRHHATQLKDNMAESELNIALSGNEARILVAALMSTEMSAPVGPTIHLFMRLNELSVNQPPEVTA
jgi:hypothetical protein